MPSLNLLIKFARQSKRRQMKQKYFLHPLVWSLMSLLMLASFIILHLSVEKIVVLGNVSDNFDWLRNSNYLSSFVHPAESTEILLPRNIKGFRQRDEVVCFVMSAPKNRFARSAIRRTWGNIIRPLFILGLSDNDTMISLRNEAEVFDDIIIENFIDSYQNLTLKTGFALKQFMKHFRNSTYFCKIDDDVSVNVENFFKFLHADDAPKNAIIGRKGESRRPHRDRESKWFIPRWLYRQDTFPSYVDGPAYLIPGHMVGELYSTSLKLPFFTLEDVFFTGYIGTKTLRYNLHSNKRFRMSNLPYHSPCLHEYFIIVHSISPSDMVEQFNRNSREYSCSLLNKFMAFMVYRFNIHL